MKRRHPVTFGLIAGLVLFEAPLFGQAGSPSTNSGTNTSSVKAMGKNGGRQVAKRPLAHGAVVGNINRARNPQEETQASYLIKQIDMRRMQMRQMDMRQKMLLDKQKITPKTPTDRSANRPTGTTNSQ
jgi:hypothetical protein